MRKTLIAALMFALIWLNLPLASAQQIPFLPELLKGTEEINQLYMEKKRAGRDLAAIDPIRTRGEEAFSRGNIPGVLEVLGQSRAVLNGKEWNDKEKFISSLTIDSDRLIIEGNTEIQVTLMRMFPTNIEKTFPKPPTVTFEIRPMERRTTISQTGSPPPPGSLVISNPISIAETNTTTRARATLEDGAYWVIASIESEGQKIAEVKKLIFAIGDFTGRLAELSKRVESIKNSSEPNIKAVAQYITTPEFRIERLKPLTSTRGETDIYPTDEIEEIESALIALAKGENPYKDETGEIERAYRGSDGKLIPYRAYIPESYDGQEARPLVVMLHGALGDERTYLSGLYDPTVIKGEADRRRCILVTPNGRSRLSTYQGLAQEDVFEVIKDISRYYRIDANRIYLTGHSMGGGGTWVVAASNPNMFAAIAPVAGAPPAQSSATKEMLAKLKNTPLLIAHGKRDMIVPVARSHDIAEAAKKAGLNITYLEVPDADHITIVGATFPAIMDFFEKNTKQAAKPTR
jgi:predicted esterase